MIAEFDDVEYNLEKQCACGAVCALHHLVHRGYGAPGSVALWDGLQAIHYFIHCLVAIIGTIQAVAVRYGRHDLVWIAERGGYWFGGTLIISSFVWFFLVDEEIFIPGLAGGELFAVFVAALLIAVPITRVVNAALVRLRWLAALPKAPEREKEPLA